MPEYLAPGVYVEETSFRSKSIEGVSTSTAGFIGPARFGPISGQPELLVSFADFERYYGSMEDLSFGVNYLALGVRAFFEEGGRRCYVTRVFSGDAAANAAKVPLDIGQAVPRPALVARFPGVAGNMRVTFSLKRSDNILSTQAGQNVLGRALAGDVVYLADGAGTGFYTVSGEGTAAAPWELLNAAQVATPVAGLGAGVKVLPISVVVSVERPTNASATGFTGLETIGDFSLNTERPSGLTNVFTQDPQTRLDELTIPFAVVTEDPGDTYADFGGTALDLLTKLIPLGGKDPADKKAIISSAFTLVGGTDGSVPQAVDYEGKEKDADSEATGLQTFEAVPDISIVAGPGYTNYERDQDQMLGIHRALITHCETMRYRIAVLDTPPDYLVTQALAFRNLTSSKYAAIYYPWVFVSDPRPARPGQPVTRLKLPPSGFVAGIYARNDIEHAVFKAPANEVVRQAIDFEQRLSKAHQEVLNPEGVNCFRFFEGRGLLLWGARTISDDPEWKYVSLRRYFAYLERSIERGTQWAVFENNGHALWANVRHTIEDFLYNEWRNGGLLGEKPEKAFFVRCDRSTMTQNDLDNGRLVCLIGVAPVRPAEFVIFRIGQWTADSQS